MKHKTPTLIGTALCSLFALVQSAAAQGTVFTYQGRLNSGSSPAAGTYDFTFALYPTNNTTSGQVGATLTNLGVGVTNGIFTTSLDFGANFPGASRWLAIGVRSNGGSIFTALTPLQAVTPAPYAIFAPNAGSAATATTAASANSVAATNIVGPIQTAQINDGGTGAYQAFQDSVQAVGGDTSLVFSNLFPVANVSGAPQFSLTINSVAFGTVIGFAGTEGMSQPYSYVVQVQTTSAATSPDAELGLPAKLTFTRNGRTTTFAGLVTACTGASANSPNFLYTVKIESPLAYMALNTDYQIYQTETVPNIVASAYIGDTTNAAPATNLTSTNETHTSLTQYAETDLNFISRIMENEGIFYFFNQGTSPPSLTLGDNTGAYLASPNSPFVYYGNTNGSSIPAGAEFIRTFQKASHQSVLSTSVSADGTGLLTATGTEGVGNYNEFGDAVGDGTYEQQLANVRQNRQTVVRAAIAGSSAAPDVRAGYTFVLTDSSGAGVGGTYLATCVHQAGYVRVTNGVSTCFFGNEFEAIPASVTYTPALKTPKPQAKPCLATVTGPGGEEIFVDQYGRVKALFDWNHSGKSDNTASEWIPVATPWAGSQHGIIFSPRIGDKVVVSFLEGDPDQPIITGSMYSPTGTPPFSLPLNKTQSGILTSSSLGGNGFNELRFDDKAGAESILLRAQKDMTLQILNNLTQSVSGTANETFGNALNLNATGNLSLTSGTGIALNGPVSLNDLVSSSVSAVGGFNSPAVKVQNSNTTTNSSPALRVIALGSPVFGALSVSTGGPVGSSFTNPIVSFGNANTWVSFLDNNGNWFADGTYTANAFINLSDRNAKENFSGISPKDVLDKVAALPLSRWNYKGDHASAHLGPMAQDFRAAFNLGADDRHIATVDEEGVALAAIQGLNQKLGEKDVEIQTLKEQNETLENRLNKLEKAVDSLSREKP